VISGVVSAIWRFAWERFRALAQLVIADLKRLPASGVCGDAVEDSDGLPLETRYEIQLGPHDQLATAWEETIRPFWRLPSPRSQ